MESQAIIKTEIKKFLELAGKFPVIDVRSPSEFNRGHIPGAYNIPLFDDHEREVVGIRYKKSGRTGAILKGLELSGPLLYSKLDQALKISRDGVLLVHCWRGGMRSEAMAWLFSMGDIKTTILEGGYKSYRRHVLESLSVNRKLILLGGLTGSGKTGILRHLKDKGRMVADLEELANHRGSAFGSLGQAPQPSTEHYANMLFDVWKKFDQDEPVWIEDESRNIGTVFLPDEFYMNMQRNPAIILMMDAKVRLPRLIREYSVYPTDELEASIMRIRKRLGGEITKKALGAVREGDLAGAIEIILTYYDKAYLHGLKSRDQRNICYITTDTDNIEINAGKLIEAAKSLHK